jgi:hypothetical protein
VIQKEAQTLIFLHEKLESHLGSKITKKNIFIKAPLCSKAKAFLEACGWKVWQENV